MRQQGELPAELVILSEPFRRPEDPPVARGAIEVRAVLQPATRVLGSHRAPATRVLGSHRAPGSALLRTAARATRPSTALSYARDHRGRTALALFVGASVIAVAAVLASGLLASNALQSAGPSADKQPHAAPPAVAPFPAIVPSPSGAAPSPSPAPSHQPSPAPSPQPAVGTVVAAPTAAPAPPAPVLITFADGTDGWSPFWGNITGTPVTRPAIDGASLLLRTYGDRYSAVGTTTDVAQLTTGDTVTYHVWVSGQPGSIRPFIEDDSFTIIFAGSNDVALPYQQGWYTLTWTVPSTSSVRGIGLQVINPNRGSLTLAIGALSWPSAA
jgi:hypothetical protein